MSAHRISSLLLVLVTSAVSLVGQDWSTPVQLTTDPYREGFPAWTPDGKSILFSRFSWNDTLGRNGIWKISPDDRRESQVFPGMAEHPNVSPDGAWIVFDGDTGRSIRRMKADAPKPEKFLPDSLTIHSGGLPCWSPSGSHIAFKDSGGALWVHSVRTGVTANIFHREGFIALPGCWSRNGENVLIALMDRKTRLSTVREVSADGRNERQITGHRDSLYRYLALSPDGSLLVYAAMQGRRLGLWVMPAEGGRSLPLVVMPEAHHESPAWSPDGKRLAFASGRTGNGDIYMMEVDVEKVKAELRRLSHPDR